MLPFGLADVLSSTLDFPTFGKTVWITAREMIGNMLFAGTFLALVSCAPRVQTSSAYGPSYRSPNFDPYGTPVLLLLPPSSCHLISQARYNLI